MGDYIWKSKFNVCYTNNKGQVVNEVIDGNSSIIVENQFRDKYHSIIKEWHGISLIRHNR